MVAVKKLTNSQTLAVTHPGFITYQDALMTMFATELGTSSLKGGDGVTVDYIIINICIVLVYSM